MLDAAAFLGQGDIVLMTFDTLRYDVAVREWAAGRTPNLAAVLLPSGWEERHTPGSFTYAAHQAFFAGFLPTPKAPGPHPRLFAARFAGSETSTPQTAVFDAPELVSGLKQRGYHTICIGGVGFFNQKTPLGSVLPALFDEAHWDESLGVTEPSSTENQVRLATTQLPRRAGAGGQDIFLFLNLSALHQPNYFYLPGQTREQGDTLESHAAALRYVDSQLPPLFDALRARGTSLCILCSDHGTTYGDDGYTGHRLAHPAVWTVPYAEFLLAP
ncbi:STM4013/SEN3800 family hydrolase [Armatimonas sp.]|uniref:STM4013/SEN3800 family hydrolase n=1 Tax=Armatimonas sp. TaxID=1872638 RepID=UPI00374D9EF8